MNHEQPHWYIKQWDVVLTLNNLSNSKIITGRKSTHGFAQKGLYTDATESWLAKHVDDPASKKQRHLVEQLNDNRKTTVKSEILDVAVELMLWQEMRSRYWVLESQRDLQTIVLNSIDEKGDAYSKAFDKVADDESNLGLHEIVINQFSGKMVAETLDKVRRKWHSAIIKMPGFAVTSDNPIVHLTSHNVMFPISPDYMLWMCDAPGSRVLHKRIIDDFHLEDGNYEKFWSGIIEQSASIAVSQKVAVVLTQYLKEKLHLKEGITSRVLE